jgi:hypothetical protein
MVKSWKRAKSFRPFDRIWASKYFFQYKCYLYTTYNICIELYLVGYLRSALREKRTIYTARRSENKEEVQRKLMKYFFGGLDGVEPLQIVCYIHFYMEHWAQISDNSACQDTYGNLSFFRWFHTYTLLILILLIQLLENPLAPLY